VVMAGCCDGGSAVTMVRGMSAEFKVKFANSVLFLAHPEGCDYTECALTLWRGFSARSADYNHPAMVFLAHQMSLTKVNLNHR
jgi:hypothetical protein